MFGFGEIYFSCFFWQRWQVCCYCRHQLVYWLFVVFLYTCIYVNEKPFLLFLCVLLFSICFVKQNFVGFFSCTFGNVVKVCCSCRQWFVWWLFVVFVCVHYCFVYMIVCGPCIFSVCYHLSFDFFDNIYLILATLSSGMFSPPAPGLTIFFIVLLFVCFYCV